MALKWELPPSVAWIPTKFTQWAAWKPTIRCAVAAWISFVLFLIVPIERTLGQASFFVIIIAIINPPSDPLAVFLDRQTWIFIMVGLAWGWATIAYVIANAVRGNAVPLSSLARESDRYPGLQASNPETFLQYAIFDGVFLETKVSAVFATFLGVGVAIATYVRTKFMPLFGLPFSSIFACITLDVILTYGALIPSFDAILGSVFLLPMAVYTAVAIVCSLVVFPESVQHQYCVRYMSVITGIKAIVDEQPKMLATAPSSEEWAGFKTLKAKREGLGETYTALDASASNLNREVSYGRFSHDELKELQDGLRKIIIRAGGLTYFHRTISEWQERSKEAEGSRVEILSHPASRIPSRVPSRVQSRVPSRVPSRDSSPQRTPNGADLSHTMIQEDGLASHILHPLESEDSLSRIESSQTLQREGRRRSKLNFSIFNHHSEGHLTPLAPPKPVGIFESIRLMTVVDRFANAGDRQNVDEMIAELGIAVADMNAVCSEVLASILVFFGAVKDEHLFAFGKAKKRAELRASDLKEKEALRVKLEDAITAFKNDKRLSMLEPYRSALEPTGAHPHADPDQLPYRGLFFISLYSFHSSEFAAVLLDLFDDVIALEATRTKSKVWFPHLTMNKFMASGRSEEHEIDEDPEYIQGLEEYISAEGVQARDPDAEAPSNAFYYVGGKIQRAIASIFHRGDAFFAAKAGIITVIVAMPQYVQATSSFFYYNRGLWVIIMAQLTLQRWAGDTLLQWFYRVIATFGGGIVGICLWYIGSGSGPGNPYGLAAVGVVAFPLILFLRVNSPVPYLVLWILFCVTSWLVVGYSRQDGVGGFTLANPGIGWDVGWRRFLLVLIGITIAAIFALIPPDTSRRSVRKTLARSINEMGGVHAELLSYAGRAHSHPDSIIIDNLVRINVKVRRYLGARIAAALWEPNLQGHWPADKYRKLQETLLELSDLLGQLMTIYWRIGAPHLDRRWREGLVLRTRFLQPTFIGETMAVYYILATALKTGTPLPQILPTPLVDRAFDRKYGLRVPHGADPDASAVPEKQSRTGLAAGGRTSKDEKSMNDPLSEKHVRLDEPSRDDISSRPSQTLDTQDLDFQTISDEGYMIFVTGVLTTFDLLVRLDRLVMVVRELVGESYPIRGLDRRAVYGDEV